MALLLRAASTEGDGQAAYDDAAARLAASFHGLFEAGRSEPLDGHAGDRSDRRSREWRRVTDEELRRRSSYHAPRGYRFHRSVRVNLDHDGRPDVVEMVERYGRRALRISYGGGGRVAVVAVRDGHWTDQGLFAVGADAVLVNFPESSAYFLFQRGHEVRAEFAGD